MVNFSWVNAVTNLKLSWDGVVQRDGSRQAFIRGDETSLSFFDRTDIKRGVVRAAQARGLKGEVTFDVEQPCTRVDERLVHGGGGAAPGDKRLGARHVGRGATARSITVEACACNERKFFENFWSNFFTKTLATKCVLYLLQNWQYAPPSRPWDLGITR